MAEDFLIGSRLRREKSHFFLNDIEVSGVQGIQAQLQTNLIPLKYIGMDCVAMVPRGAQGGSVNINGYVIGKDPFLRFTGYEGFNGYIVKNKLNVKENYGFISGYLNSYTTRCSIGEIPQYSVSIGVVGDMGRLPVSGGDQSEQNLYNIKDYESETPFNVVSPGSIEIGLDDFQTNRVLSYEISLEIPRNPIYYLGSNRPHTVEINWPIEVNATFQMEIDDYSPTRLNDYPCSPKVKDLTVKLKDYTSDIEVQNFSFKDMVLVGESFNHGIDGNVTVSLNYKTYLLRPTLEPLQALTGMAKYVLAGGVTNRSAQVAAQTSSDAVNFQFVAYTRNLSGLNFEDQDILKDLVYSDFTTGNSSNDRMAKSQFKGLRDNTQYYYALVSGKKIDTNMVGKFKTPGVNDYSFKFAFASCSNNTLGSTSSASTWTDLKTGNYLFFAHLGDFHYNNIVTAGTSQTIYRAAYNDIFNGAGSQGGQKLLYQDIPLVYTWDDHDYSNNDSNGTYGGKAGAQLTYREHIPSYKLVETGAAPIYHAFTIGNCRFIVTDLRSERSPKTNTDNSSKTMMGATQKAWFKKEMLDAKDKYPVVFWLCSVGWLGSALANDDAWRGYSTERQEIANFLRDNGIDKVIILSGDTHNLGYDDGSNSDFSSGGGSKVHVFHSGPLDQSPSAGGGPFSESGHPILANYQYGEIDVEDNANELTLRLKGKRSPNSQTLFTKTIVRKH